MSADNSLLTIEYVPVDEAVLWDRNPKWHDIAALVESIWTYGFQDPSKYDAALEAIVYGNGRIQAVQPGQRLTAAGTPGTSRALRTVQVEGVSVDESGPTLDVALEAPQDGLVWVLVNPQ